MEVDDIISYRDVVTAESKAVHVTFDQ